MPETDELYASIGHIKHKVDSIDKGLTILLRLNGGAMTEKYISDLTADPLMGQIYLQVDGQKTQQQIAACINSSEATVSRRIQKLIDLDLIELSYQCDEGKIYRHTRMESLFKLSRKLKAQQK